MPNWAPNLSRELTPLASNLIGLLLWPLPLLLPIKPTPAKPLSRPGSWTKLRLCVCVQELKTLEPKFAKARIICMPMISNHSKQPRQLGRHENPGFAVTSGRVARQ